jgi:hypothetical protein
MCSRNRSIDEARPWRIYSTHSAQNSDITREERQAAISRQKVTNITKMFDKKMRFTGEIGNGKVPLDQTISAYRSICQAIVASDEDARRAMFMVFSDAALFYFYKHDTEWYSVSEVFGGLRGIFYDVATIEQLEIELTEYTWLRLKSDNPNITVLCAAKDETSVDTMRRMFCCNFLRKSRL